MAALLNVDVLRQHALPPAFMVSPDAAAGFARDGTVTSGLTVQAPTGRDVAPRHRWPPGMSLGGQRSSNPRPSSQLITPGTALAVSRPARASALPKCVRGPVVTSRVHDRSRHPP